MRRAAGIVGVLAFVLAACGGSTSDSAAKPRKTSTSTTTTTTTLAMTAAQVCDSFYETMIEGIKQRLPDSELTPRFRTLATQAGATDVVTATDIGAVADARSPADVSANVQVVFRRCGGL